MTSQHDIDQAIEQVFRKVAVSANEEELLHQLDNELVQQQQSQALVLGGEEPAPWVLHGENTSTMAQRFIGFYADALSRELCDPEQGRIKNKYRSLVTTDNANDRVKALVPTVLAVIGVGASLVNPAVIAVLVALWLIRLGLDQWCARPSASTLTPGETSV